MLGSPLFDFPRKIRPGKTQPKPFSAIKATPPVQNAFLVQFVGMKNEGPVAGHSWFNPPRLIRIPLRESAASVSLGSRGVDSVQFRFQQAFGNDQRTDGSMNIAVACGDHLVRRHIQRIGLR
jgi:hypothetical protein